MIHPAVVVPFGVFANVMYGIIAFCCIKPLARNICKNEGNFQKIIGRMFTLTFNAYLSFVGIAMYYLFKSSVTYRQTSEFFLVARHDFKGLIFNRCDCESKSNGTHCINTDTNFQNIFSTVPNEIILLIFMIYPMITHLVYSFFYKESFAGHLIRLYPWTKNCID